MFLFPVMRARWRSEPTKSRWRSGLAAGKRGIEIEIVSTGSRGMYWLEPLIEVATPQGRMAYGPVTRVDVNHPRCDGIRRRQHPLRLGTPRRSSLSQAADAPDLRALRHHRPRSLEDYRAHDGYKGLERALTLASPHIVDEVTQSGLRGRGGAGFPTGIKWKTVAETKADRKYIVCNADEGDSGTFADRMIMEGDPFVLIEGMTIAGIAVGATKGYIYIRSEYPHAIEAMNEASRPRGARLSRRAHRRLGAQLRLELRVGAGAYVCGEETALLESLEGRRGMVRAKPPLPAHKGLFGKPTVINNVLSLATVPFILAHGAKAYADFGMGRSRGTMPMQIAGNVRMAACSRRPSA